MAKKAAKGRALKVFRTAIGFDDAYVAAPSKKAALAAWGTDKDLFARGAAEVIDDATSIDPGLTAQALAAPGTVIRRTRGSLAEQLKAAGNAPPATPRRQAAPEPDEAPAPKRKARSARRSDPGSTAPPRPRPEARPMEHRPKPRPSRELLNTAEAALAAAQDKVNADRAALRREEDALRERRSAFEREQRETLARLDEAITAARRAYEAELQRWSADD